MKFFLLAALLWPAPCADPGTCWLAWDRPAGVIETYEIWAGDVRCAVLKGRQKRNKAWVPPPPVFQPRPDGLCWSHDQSVSYRVRACNRWGCSRFDVDVPFGPQFVICFDHRGQVDCLTNQSLRGAP